MERPGRLAAAGALALFMAVAAASEGTAASAAASLANPDLGGLVRGLAIGEPIRIEDVHLEADGEPEVLELERFRLFAPDARVQVHGDAGVQTLVPPDNVYLRGTVSGRPGSRVSLTWLETGELRGTVTDLGRLWLLVRQPGDPARRLSEVTDHPALSGADRAFECAADLLPQSAAAARAASAGSADDADPDTFTSTAAHTARMAIETDFEYYQLFGSIPAAVSYAGDLFAHASGYYATEVGADFWIQSVSLWTTANDPWTQSSSLCALAEFGRYWNDNNSTIQRTLAHFLSGKSAGGGIAWTGVLCSAGFSVDISTWGCSLSPAVGDYGGDYGFSGNISGSFNPANPTVVWDIFAISHEVGHNFNSPHTHCFSPPIDGCYGGETGCYSGPTSLPCPNPGAGCGTIMSYCHLISPGMSNVSLTLGQGHPWGTDPGRVPAVMSAHVASIAASNPLCLAPAVFEDGFESGDRSAWSSSVP
jgi:hypothetical protein